MSEEFNLIEATKAGLRAAATTVPALAPFIQVWNEHEAVELSRRVDRFWMAFVNEAKLCGRRLEAMERSVESVAESLQVIQEALASARRDSVPEKQEMLGKAAARMVAAGQTVHHDTKLSIIDALDSLTLSDIQCLRGLRGHERVKVAALAPDYNSKRLGELVLSLSKLESRGLIGQTDGPDSDTNAWTGSAERWDNQWRQRFYCVLPAGDAMLEAIDGKEG